MGLTCPLRRVFDIHVLFRETVIFLSFCVVGNGQINECGALLDGTVR